MARQSRCIFTSTDEWLPLHLQGCSRKAKALYERPEWREWVHGLINDDWESHPFEKRHEELMRALVARHSEQTSLFRRIARRIFPWLSPYSWSVQREARRLQAVELAHEVAVLKALLALERAEPGSGSGGKRQRTSPPARALPHMTHQPSSPLWLN